MLAANVQGLVSRGKLTKDKAEKALSMLKGVLDYSEFRDVDMVIEVSHAMEFITFPNHRLLQFVYKMAHQLAFSTWPHINFHDYLYSEYVNLYLVTLDFLMLEDLQLKISNVVPLCRLLLKMFL